MKCDNVHCFKQSDEYCNVIFTKPSQSESYTFCRDCYRLVILTVRRLVDFTDYATVAQSGSSDGLKVRAS